MSVLYSPRGVSEEDFEEHLFYEKNLPKKIRLFVFERDAYMCRSCNDNTGIAPHHITFRSAGGTHSPDNLVTLCFNCHRKVHDGFLLVGQVNGSFFFGGKRRWK